MPGLADLSLYSKTMLAFCGVTGLVIGAEALVLNNDSSTADSETAQELSASEDTAIAMADPLQIPPVVAYREIVERPLFSDTRRPPDKAAPAAAAAANEQLNAKWKLTGIVVVGENSFVRVAGIRDQETVRLQMGMPLDGWKLEQIKTDHVVFSSAGRSAILKLHEEELPVTPLQRR